jgi:low affinity Fe/Cu permease
MIRNSKCAGRPVAMVGMFDRSVWLMIVISGSGMLAAFCETWLLFDAQAEYDSVAHDHFSLHAESAR